MNNQVQTSQLPFNLQPDWYERIPTLAWFGISYAGMDNRDGEHVFLFGYPDLDFVLTKGEERVTVRITEDHHGVEFSTSVEADLSDYFQRRRNGEEQFWTDSVMCGCILYAINKAALAKARETLEIENEFGEDESKLLLLESFWKALDIVANEWLPIEVE